MNYRISIRRPSTDHFIHGLFLLSTLFLLGIFALIFMHQSPNHSFQRREVTVSQTSFVNNYTVRYPAFNEPTIDAVLRGFVEKKIRTFEGKLANKNDPRNHLTTDFAVMHFGERSLSLTLNTTERVMGAPENTLTEYVTFDIQQDRLLTIQDILQPAPSTRTVLAKLLHDYFKQQASLGLTPVELVNLLDLSIDDLRDFALVPDALVVFLNPRQPSLPENKVAVSINKTLLEGILAAPYSTPEPDRSEVAETIIAYHITEKPPAGNSINPSAKMIALTFDDGPNHLTPQLLDALDRYEADATFFVLGKMVPSHAGILQRMLAEGNEIGNHTWGHPMLTHLSAGDIDHQIAATQAAVQTATGYTPTLMRPPYGATNATVAHFAAARGLREVLWSVDTNDWLDRDAGLIYNRIMTSAADGGIVLLHDIHPTSVEASVRAIRDLKAQGYQLVTVSQLLEHHR